MQINLSMYIRKDNNNNQRNREDRRNNNSQVVEALNKIKCYSYDEEKHKSNDLTCFKYVEWQEKRNRRENETKKVRT